MGGCFSKKKVSSTHNNPQPQPKEVPLSSAVAPVAAETTLKAGAEPKSQLQVTEEEHVVKASQEKSLVKKEVFIIKHRKSHDTDKRSPPPPPPQNPPQSAENEPASSASTEGGICNINTSTVRTSSCTKEEVDAILIQCGRLSRSNSSCKTPSSRKYSGSKRSFDFDRENENDIGAATSTDYGSRKKGNESLRENDDRPRRRPSSRSSSQGRRRTPSREREQQQRSGSRERGSSGSGGGRRVSRSPGKRSENSEGTHGTNAANGTNRPGKMVSVPPTVSSLATDKSINGVEAATTTANGVKRISVKRNVGESPARTAASPRSQSPAKTNPNPNNAKGCNENQQQPALSRSSSRKAEHSPYRRNPLSEIDPNSLAYPQSVANKGQVGIKKSNVKGTAKESPMVEDSKTQAAPKAGADNLKPQSLTRSRSSRRSRELDLNPETLVNPIPSSYTTLLLEDIQNFHQNNTNPPQFSLPACVSKACSILEAVADLNSTTSSNFSDKKGLPTDNSNKNGYNISAVGQKMKETRDPFVESEVIESVHLMEPSFHKYVTVRRGVDGADMEEQESSGSNSIVCSGQQQWGFSGSSSWEPSSADSMDRWTSSTPLGHSKCMR
ncbi:putative Retrotransposon protein [Hibiscus syriacus]|uniref:Retrotransposon protein n=1 Tax=Hibiscus syriacus TaxID=106335 RepID=A0A6A2WZ97_HIBSY|nr:uncharacterized protein At1g65710-like [Hibiscus syriacus]KAE8655006.1 putative Retrotransposon protein [Hibiscus syriacus]